MKRYELVLLDADGTLYDYDKAESFALQNMLEHFNVAYSEEFLKMYKEKNDAIWKEFEKKQIDAESLKSERFRRFFETAQIEADHEEAGKKYLYFLRQADFQFEQSLEAMKYLKKKYKIVIITNGLTYVQEKRIGESNLMKFADALIISESIGIPKPYKGIFDSAFESVSHSDRTTAIIIGDSFSSDIMGGINYGIDTCWISAGRDYNYEKKPDYIIEHIGLVNNIL